MKAGLGFWLGASSLAVPLLVNAAEVDVVLENPPSEGRISVAFFDSENAFGDFRDPVKVVRFTLDGSDSYRVSDLPGGEYAMMVYFDENGNEQIDKNFIGIPREPLGFSNDYQPKGPPAYSRAAFTVNEFDEMRFDVELYKPLGDRGRIGVGAGVIGRSSPFKDYDGNVTQVIPAITYTGERLRVFGPNAEYGILGSGKVRLALSGQYRIGVYEEADSPFLEGMGDRESTFMAGFSTQAELSAGFELSASYQHDVLDRIGGGEGRLDLDKSLQFGVVRLSPYLAVNWLSEDLANHDYGVEPGQALAGRPAYEVGSFVSYEAGTGALIEITEDWLFVFSLGYEALPSEVTASPIVEDDYTIKGFGALNYVF